MTNKESKSQAQLPRGFVRLQGSLDYDNWVYTSKAQWETMGILYVLTETNPQLEEEVKTVPLTPDQVEVRTLQWRDTEQNRVSIHNTNVVVRRQTAGEELEEGDLLVADYATMPDFTSITRDETAAEKAKRVAKYETDCTKMWSNIVSTCAAEPLSVVRSGTDADKPNGRLAFDVLKAKYDAVTTSTVVSLLKRTFDIQQNGPIERHLE